MDYQVWTKEEFGDLYTKFDCGDLSAAKRRIDEAVRAGQEPILTMEVPYELAIKVGEVGAEKPKLGKRSKQAQDEIDEEAKSEVTEDKTKPDKDPGG